MAIVNIIPQSDLCNGIMAHTVEKQPNRIRFWRKYRGLTLEQLGAEVGVGKAMMGLIERGERPLTTQREIAIARALGVDIFDLKLPDEVENVVPHEERAFWSSYLSLGPKTRQIVKNLVADLAELHEPPGPDDRG